MGSINTDTEYLLDTIWEPITPSDQHINEQQKEYIEMISTNTLIELGNRMGLGSQPRYKAPGDLHVENVKHSDKHRVSEWSCPLDNGPKLAVGQPNSS